MKVSEILNRKLQYSCSVLITFQVVFQSLFDRLHVLSLDLKSVINFVIGHIYIV